MSHFCHPRSVSAGLDTAHESSSTSNKCRSLRYQLEEFLILWVMPQRTSSIDASNYVLKVSGFAFLTCSLHYLIRRILGERRLLFDRSKAKVCSPCFNFFHHTLFCEICNIWYVRTSFPKVDFNSTVPWSIRKRNYLYDATVCISFEWGPEMFLIWNSSFLFRRVV